MHGRKHRLPNVFAYSFILVRQKHCLGQEETLLKLLGREMVLKLRKFRGADDPEPPQDGVEVEFREDLTIAIND